MTTSFKDFDFTEFFTDIADDDIKRDCESAIRETIIEQLGELEAIEEFAEYHGLIESESELSERFDDEHEDWLEKMNNKGDQVAIDTYFNDWTDGLCKDGLIHETQYSNYCYVGKYSRD